MQRKDQPLLGPPADQADDAAAEGEADRQRQAPIGETRRHHYPFTILDCRLQILDCACNPKSKI
jgi:hypothetical protein